MKRDRLRYLSSTQPPSAIDPTLQATAQDGIKGADCSLAADRSVVTGAALLQDSLVQGFSAIANSRHAIFAAMTPDRLRSDRRDLLAAIINGGRAAANDAVLEMRRVG